VQNDSSGVESGCSSMSLLIFARRSLPTKGEVTENPFVGELIRIDLFPVSSVRRIGTE
jgi:hypothetical protein